MKVKRATVTEATLKAIAAKALEMPEKPSQRDVSAREAVTSLKREIQTLQKRGYTLDEVAEFLTGQGMPISSPTLRAYLQRSGAARRSKKTTSAETQESTSAAQPVQQKEDKPANEKKGRFVPRADSDDI